MAGSLTIMIKDIRRRVNPDYLFVEPFELVVTAEMLTALRMGTRDVDYEIGPVFALVDAPEFGFLWQERRQTVMNHINKSLRTAITRADRVDKQKLQHIREVLRKEAHVDHVLSVSIPDGKGVDEVIADIS